jgi:hypothetical protein
MIVGERRAKAVLSKRNKTTHETLPARTCLGTMAYQRTRVHPGAVGQEGNFSLRADDGSFRRQVEIKKYELLIQK